MYIYIYICMYMHAFSLYFVNLKISSPQIIKTFTLMEESKNKNVWGDRILYYHSFMRLSELTYLV